MRNIGGWLASQRGALDIALTGRVTCCPESGLFMRGGDAIPAICRALNFTFTVAAPGGTLTLGARLQEPVHVDGISRALAIYASDVAFTCTRRANSSSHKSPPN